MSTEISTTIPTARDWATKIGIKAYRYRALVQRRWWILAAAVALGLLCETWILIRQPVLFESVGKMVVGGGLSVSDGTKIDEDLDGFYQTQINILQGQGMKDLTSQALELSYPKLHGTITILASNEARSKILDVAGRGSNPEYTQKYVDELMSQFMQYRNEQTRNVAGRFFDSIRAQLTDTEAKLNKQRRDLQDFKDAHPFWEQEVKNSEDNLTALKKQQADKLLLLNQLQTLSSHQILDEGLLRNGSKPSPEDTQPSGGGSSISAPDLNQKYNQAIQDLAQKRAELEERQKVWKPEHPGIKLINDQIKALQLLIKTIEDESDKTRKERIVELQSDLRSLDATIADWEKKATQATHLDGEYRLLQGAVTTTDSLYQELLKKLQGATAPPATETSITVLQQAPAAGRVPPGVVKHLMIGLILGLVFGGIVLYIIDRADDRVSSSTEMVEHFPESLLGQIPNVSDSRVEAGLPLLQHEDPRYTYAEAFRSLRSSLIFMPNQGELKSIIITSSIPGEGKSTISSNLAVTMAIAGARVLLVDADLRRGDLASLFDVDGRVGLSSVLRGEVGWQSAVQKTRLPSLTLLPRGPVTNQSGELLLLPTFDPMMEEFRNNFDLILFNTSPILATDDTPTIAPHFDGTLMVLRASFTSARLVHNSLNALYQRQVNVLGLILNCVDTEMPDYYYYRYPKYYAV